MIDLPQLTPDVPGAPTDETQVYSFPPATPLAPSPLQCTPDDLHQLALDATNGGAELLQLCGSPQHVRAICSLVVNQLEPRITVLEQQLAVSQSAGDACMRNMIGANASADMLLTRALDHGAEAKELREYLIAEQRQAARWHRQALELAGENADLRAANLEITAELLQMSARLEMSMRVSVHGALDRAARTITSMPYDELNARLDEESAADTETVQ